MDFAYDLSGGSSAIVKKFQVAASNTVLGRPYLQAAGNGSGIALATTDTLTNCVGVNIDAAGTYVTAQQSDNSDTARTTSIIINPQAIYRARLSGGATDGTALTAQAITTASADGLSVVTSAFDPNSPDLDEGTTWGYSGANAGKARKITATAANDATVVVSFPFDIAVGDEFLYAPVNPTSTVLLWFTTNMTEVDATLAIASGATVVVTEMLLNDSAGNGTTESYAFISLADSLFAGQVT